MFKRRYSAEEKYEILTALGNEHSTHEIASIYKVHHSSILEWKHKFDKFGVDGLKKSSTSSKAIVGLIFNLCTFFPSCRQDPMRVKNNLNRR